MPPPFHIFNKDSKLSNLLANADKIFKENNKAVVVVVTYNAKGKPISQGSGFIVRPDGAVITNYHVISNAVDIAVKAGDKVLKVEGLLYIDKENDLVILKIKGKELPTAAAAVNNEDLTL